MTVVASFKCAGGTVLCADAQETANQVKWTVEKLVPYQRDWCQGGFGGSGSNGDIIDALIERLVDALDKGYDDLSRIRLVIERTLLGFYRNEINAHPWQDEDKTVELLSCRPRPATRFTSK